MKTRTIALGLSLSAYFSYAVAQAPAPGGAPAAPPAQAAAKKKPDDIRDFTTQDAATKAQVLGFKDWDMLDKPGAVRWGFTSTTHAIGDVDNRDPADRYRDFDHPRVQPRPDEPVWRAYLNVDNPPSTAPKRPGLPVVCRPDDETWLSLKPSDPMPDPCRTVPVGPLRFDSLPIIQAADSIRVTYVETPDGIFPSLDPFLKPPGTNMLPTVYSDVFDGDNTRIENSLPSSIEKRYNLHEGEPVVTPINPRSPTNDLEHVFETLYTLLTGSSPKHLWERLDRERYEDTFAALKKNSAVIKANRARIDRYLAMAIDIIEGNEVADRAYSGFPLLHHSGQRRVHRIVPILDRAAGRETPVVADPLDNGQPIPAIAMGPNVVGGNARVHQVWFDGRIESDTMFLDWQGEYDGCRVLLAKYNNVGEIPSRGDNLMIVAKIGTELHFRLFDGDRRPVPLPEDPAHLAARKPMIDVLEALATGENLWGAGAMTREQRYRVLRALLPIVGTSPFEHCLTGGCPVRLVSGIDSVENIPKGKANEMIVAQVGTKEKVLHFRFFDASATPVLDTDERHLTPRRAWLRRLEEQAVGLWSAPTLTEPQRSEIVRTLLAIVARSVLDRRLEDLNLPPIPPRVPWTVTYTIDVLDHGADDFATTTMFFDSHSATEAFLAKKQLSDPKSRFELDRQQFQTRMLGPSKGGDAQAKDAPKLHPQLSLVSMDQTFFPMRSGTRTVLTVKMPAPEYHNLTYTWGWRFHPPRAQAMEDAAKRKIPPPYAPPSNNPPVADPPSLVENEREVFTDDPATAINALGDVAPAKRMWHAFKSVRKAIDSNDFDHCLPQFLDARNAFLDWKDRTHLPSGLEPDPETDLTVLFANNTTYAQLRKGGWVELTDWRLRGQAVKVTLINADYFPHQYLNVEWGGNRGWEPQFKPTLPLAGSGTFFSFGRFHYQFNTPPGKIEVEAARRYRKDCTPIKNSDRDADEPAYTVKPGIHRLWINMNHEPSRRLRFYQFDPTHHDVAIYSLH